MVAKHLLVRRGRGVEAVEGRQGRAGASRGVRYSVFGVRYSIFGVRCSIFDIKCAVFKMSNTEHRMSNTEIEGLNAIRDEQNQKLRYIHANPVKAKLASMAQGEKPCASVARLGCGSS